MSKKVLIVDDEKAIVDILNHNLKREGYETLEAYDGEEAINLVKKESWIFCSFCCIDSAAICRFRSCK